jgi:hypothetical protein
LLNEIGIVKLIHNKQRFYGFGFNDIDIYGCGFEEEFPDIEFSKNFNILLLHKLVSNSDLWFGNVNYVSTKQLFKKTKFDLIIIGDNHKSFTDNQKDRWILNTGSMLRSNSDQSEHHPCIYLFDTKFGIPEILSIPCKPFDQVMRVEKIQEDKAISADLKAFEEELNRKDYKPEFNFLNDLEKAKSELEEDGVRNMIDEAITNANK